MLELTRACNLFLHLFQIYRCFSSLPCCQIEKAIRKIFKFDSRIIKPSSSSRYPHALPSRSRTSNCSVRKVHEPNRVYIYLIMYLIIYKNIQYLYEY